MAGFTVYSVTSNMTMAQWDRMVSLFNEKNSDADIFLASTNLSSHSLNLDAVTWATYRGGGLVPPFISFLSFCFSRRATTAFLPNYIGTCPP